MTDARETVPCRLCGKPTPMTGTKLCDRHWELEGRVLAEPDMTRRILASHTGEAEPAGWSIADDCPHMIVFDDADVSPLMFAGSGARPAALEAYKNASLQWNAHLFVRIAHNSRDDRHPDANPLAAPSAAIAAREQEAGGSAMRAALQDCLIMIERIKKHCQITDNTGYTQDGRMLKLTSVEEAARAALASREEAPATPPAATPAAPGEAAVLSIRDALAELVDLMQGVIDGNYEPDSFTLQPARAALSNPAPVAAPTDEAIEDFLAARMTNEGRVPMLKTIREALAHFAAPAPASEAVAGVAEFKGEFAQLRHQIAHWLRQWERSGVSRAASIHKALAQMHAIHFATPTPGDSADAPVQQAGASEFEQMRARTLLAHLWRRYDAAGVSMGRSHEAVVLEAVLSLLGDPDPADMELLDKDGGNLVNETRTYLSSKMRERFFGKGERFDRAALKGEQPVEPSGIKQPSAELIEAAAKVIAECMDYPWEHMPEEGRESMRKHAKAVAAVLSAHPAAPLTYDQLYKICRFTGDTTTDQADTIALAVLKALKDGKA